MNRFFYWLPHVSCGIFPSFPLYFTLDNFHCPIFQITSPLSSCVNCLLSLLIEFLIYGIRAPKRRRKRKGLSNIWRNQATDSRSLSRPNQDKYTHTHKKKKKNPEEHANTHHRKLVKTICKKKKTWSCIQNIIVT